MTLWRSGDENYDTRCVQMVYRTLISYPGEDPFSLRLVDEQQSVQIDFPNETTAYCEELVAELTAQLDVEVWLDAPPDD